jgi:uncharacterized protein YgbK (DUF1537 family)
MRIAALADDVTGATDLAGSWRSRGLRSVVVLGEPADADRSILDEMDTVVYAVKIRSVPREEARQVAARVGERLARHEGVQVYDKYCSTFDSTADGNIGPIADALADAVKARRAVVVPSMPNNGRTVYQGHLFVHDQLLSESPMRDHPLNPMRDSHVVRLMQAQTSRPVGHIPLSVVRRGAADLRRALDEAEAGGHFYLVVDAIENSDLETINAATAQDPLVTGGSGLALGAEPGRTESTPPAVVPGHRMILAGSASTATRRQVAVGAAAFPTRALDLDRVAEDGSALADELLAWARENWALDRDRPVLIHSAADTLKGRIPSQAQAEGIESVMGQLARGAWEAGARQLLIAGGETSGAVITSLGIHYLELGDEVDPGVSWARGVALSAEGDEPGPACTVLLKSGNFGSDDLFVKAWEQL